MINMCAKMSGDHKQHGIERGVVVICIVFIIRVDVRVTVGH